jgi:hypothetical protein
MKKLDIDLDEIQKAMEDTVRDAFDYFLDRETGAVIILSEDIIGRARTILEEEFDDDMADFEEVDLDGECDVPEWMEDEVELALSIFLWEQDRYVRIPERKPEHVFSAMRAFAETVADAMLREELLGILDGKGSFRRFKDALGPYAKERKQWYSFSAKKARQEIEDWLLSLGVDRRQGDDTA